jgi:hypothetical protein
MNPANPQAPQPQALLYAPAEPTPQDYADALAQLGRQGQAGIRTPGALASNLAADALLQYGQARAQRQQAANGAFGSTPGPGLQPNDWRALLQPARANLYPSAYGAPADPTGGS